jgi:hypothetical protein
LTLDLVLGDAKMSFSSSVSLPSFIASNSLLRLEELPLVTELLGAGLFFGVNGLLCGRAVLAADEDDDGASTDFFNALSFS